MRDQRAELFSFLVLSLVFSSLSSLKYFSFISTLLLCVCVCVISISNAWLDFIGRLPLFSPSVFSKGVNERTASITKHSAAGGGIYYKTRSWYILFIFFLLRPLFVSSLVGSWLCICCVCVSRRPCRWLFFFARSVCQLSSAPVSQLGQRVDSKESDLKSSSVDIQRAFRLVAAIVALTALAYYLFFFLSSSIE